MGTSMLRDLPISHHRNIGIIAHIDAGKTTCTERILFYAGRIHALGSVDRGDTEMDFGELEQQMGITISSASTSVTWAPAGGPLAGVRHRINVVDTPGHVDFTIEVERSLRVLDGAIAIFDAGNGVEPQSETVWRQADAHRVPRIAFINKMDKVGASFAAAVASIRERLGARAVAVQIPLGEESAHRGVIDLVRMKAITFDDETKGAAYRITEVPEEMLPVARRARAELIEACAELDDAVLARFVEDRVEAITEADIEGALRRATLSLRAVPVLCGSAHKNKGIQMLLDAVCAYLPSPLDVPPARGRPPGGGEEIERPADDDAPLCALAFKVMSMERLGVVTMLRIYSGRVTAGTMVRNATAGVTERVGRLVFLHANKATDAGSAGAGMIAAAIGLKHARTGDTITDPRHPLVLAGLSVPEPVVEAAIEPRTASDQERLSTALARLRVEDPSFRVAVDEETGQTLLRGMGELHLTILVDRLQREHRVEVRTGKPSVAYRETIAKAARGEHRLSKQNGGQGQYAHVVLEIAPAPGRGILFEDRSRGGVIPREFVPAIEAGVRGATSRGVLAGYPVVDVEVRLLDGSFHAVDSRPAAFEVAAAMAFRKAAEAADPCVLEPIMEVEAITPEEVLGAVLADIHGRRGEVRAVTQRGNARVVSALVPLRTAFGQVADLRGRTQGRASATMRLSHYARLPPDLTVEAKRKR
ncbi:Translation elongation factor G [Minicystis rosea]|nr:Translation elongation factor G [Minicystis rosea]